MAKQVKKSKENKEDFITNWDKTSCPDFRGRKAYILPGAMKGDVIRLMFNCGFERADNVEEADVVVFVGGADVTPSYYGQNAIHSTFFDRARDEFEKGVFEECVRLGKLMFGICRGAQFLGVMNGSELWQDVTGHAGKDHYIVDVEEGCRVLATSLHHQMLKIDDNMTLVAVTEDDVTQKFEDANLLVSRGVNDVKEHLDILEIEACWYETTKCFLVQGHPEVGSNEYMSWTMTKLHDFLTEHEKEHPRVETEATPKETS